MDKIFSALISGLKAYMYSYKGIEQCKHNVVSIFKVTAPEQPAENPPLLQLEPPTPNKKAKTEDYKPGSSCQKTSPDSSTENTTMEDGAEDGETLQLKGEKKKN